MKELIENLKSIRDDVDFENCTTLVDDNVIKSFDIIRIVDMIKKEYGVKIPVSKLKPQYFNSAEAIYDLIESLEDE
ncbi:MAG: acyl carrier protein [Clostridiales bacterium]|nr:acyl carrier protein [Clostridiales bacterium]